MSSPLEDLQARFAAALLDPGRLAAIEDRIASRALRERLALYRGNLVAAHEKALANAYPVVRELVGAESFAGLARAYARAHPSASGDLDRFGAQFPGFLARFAPPALPPYLADVAALEWAVHSAERAADAASPARERIGALAAGELLASRFALHPACCWIESRFPIASIWLGHQPRTGARLPEDLSHGEIALVVRPGWRADVLRSSGGEIAALAELRDGRDMEAAIAAGLQADPGFDFPRALVRWIDDAVLVFA